MEALVKRPANVADQEAQWIFTAREVDRPPSVRSGYCSLEYERFLRLQAVRHVFKLRNFFNQGAHVSYTASLFVHRFYMIHSFEQYDLETLAAAALFLACKVEEHTQRLRDIAGVQYDLKQGRENQLSMMNGRPRYDEQTSNAEMLELRTKILEYERVMLRTLAFDLSVTQPLYLLSIIVQRVLSTATLTRLVTRAFEKEHPDSPAGQVLVPSPKEVLQVAFMILSDTLVSVACLLYPPDVIAATTVVLACAQLSIPVPNRPDRVAPIGVEKEEGEESEESDVDEFEDGTLNAERVYWLDWLQIKPDDMAECAKVMMKSFEATKDEFVRAEAAATLEEALQLTKGLSLPNLQASADLSSPGKKKQAQGTVPEGLEAMLKFA